MNRNSNALIFLIAGFLFLVAVGAGIYFSKKDTGEPSANPATVQVADANTDVTITAYVGGEKMPLLKDPAFTAIAQRYHVTVAAEKRGSGEMVASAIPGKDIIWPSTSTAADTFQQNGGTWVAKEDVFSSPLVFYSWTNVVEKLEAYGLVSTRNNVKYLDMVKLTEFITQGKTWANLGLTAKTKIKVISTSPPKSNSGLMTACLFATMLNGGDPPSETTVTKLLPELRAYYERLGQMDTSSSDLFGKFLSQGAGAYPMISAYENQLAEFKVDHPEAGTKIDANIVTLIPEPTIWSAHPVIAVNEKGKRLIEVLKDEEFKKLALERHGFRTELAGLNDTLAAVDVTVPMPSDTVAERISTALDGL